MTDQLPTTYQQFIHQSRYARWLDDKGRRETWPETVDRYLDFVAPVDLVGSSTHAELRDAILNCEVMPSMRALMTAGPAAERDNIAVYNCAYTPIDDQKRFAEILHILLCGTGVGFSVERQEVNKLPEVPELTPSELYSDIADSKRGWSEAFSELVFCLYCGTIPRFDFSQIRPAGARLKTFGGRASGPGPLKELFEFTIETFKKAQGRKLTSIEVHDIVCKIGEVVVVGGVRRSALISLSNLSDDRMRHAKDGQWWSSDSQRALANNSAVYDCKPDIGCFMREWSALYESKSGERGIFNREACHRLNERIGRATDVAHGTNPCSEIILRPQQFCNLTEVVVRKEDTIDDLSRKVRLATILGTLQARFTDFQFISSEWKETTESEALLGVSMTGIMDREILTEYELRNLRQGARATNRWWATQIGINPAAAITCVKPSGTVSQLVDCASGIHPRHSEFYIRRVRGDRKDPLTQFLMDSGVPYEDCVMKPETTVVFEFPMVSPEDCLTRNQLTAVEHLELWLHYQKYWCDHKPSVTISVREHEWMEVGAWVYENFDWMSGVSFLPHSDHSYQQAPYEECDLQEWADLMAGGPPEIDWSLLQAYERGEDHTKGAQTLACTGTVCEMVDIT